MKSNAVALFCPDVWMSETLARPVLRFQAPAEELATGVDLGSDLDPRNFPPGSFAYAKVPVDHSRLIRALELANFFLADTHIQLQKTLAVPARRGPETPRVRWACQEDRHTVVEIARQSFRFSRFHTDAHFDKALANQLKADWVDNYFLGKRGQGLLVAEIENLPVAFLLVLKTDSYWTIDLIATAPGYQRRGLARELINAFENQAYLADNIQALQVGTQLANLPSLRLYQQMGYQVIGATYLFHYHQERNT